MNIKTSAVKYVKLGVSAAFLVLGSSTLFAQQQITLKEAIQQALDNKAEAKKAALEIKKAEYKIDEARAAALPQINGSVGLNYNPVIQQSVLDFGGQKTVIKMGQPWNSTISASVSQTLFDQRVFTGLKAARSTREFYVLNATLTNEQLIANVATAYYNVFVQEENQRTLAASYSNTEKVRNIIKSLVDNGLAKQIDLDRTNVQLTNISSSQQQTVNATELSKNALKFYMGIPIETEITVVPDNIEPDASLLQSYVDLNNRTELKVLDKQKELLEFNKKATEAARYPTVGLQGNYGWYAVGSKFPWTNGLNNGVNWSDFATIGLNVNVPIFTGGAIKSKIQQAQIDIENLQLDIENTKLSLNLDYRNSLTNIENSIINLGKMKDNVKLAEKVEANTKSNYQNGLASLTELLDAQNALTQAKQNYATALLDYKQAEIQLKKAKGELNTLQN